MKVAVVLVHYHTADLAVAAFTALDRDLRESGLEAEWVLVDNGSRPEDREKLGSLPVRVVEPESNLGYAGGANLGVRETGAGIVMLMNPDVLVLPGCTAALVAALEAGSATAGPRFFWDHERRFLLPPTERRTRRDELLRTLGERSELGARLARRRWRRHARRSWTAREPQVSYELSGALLAFRRSAWEELGGFDEAYRLYFEETDWLERSRRRGLESRFLPGAEAIHLHAQSTLSEPNAGRWFAESSERFRRRFYGAAFAAVLGLLGRIWPASEARPLSRSRPGRAAWLEVSASRLGFPAAARRLDTPEDAATLPEDVLGRLGPGTYFLRTVDDAGRELGLRTFEHQGG